MPNLHRYNQCGTNIAQGQKPGGDFRAIAVRRKKREFELNAGTSLDRPKGPRLFCRVCGTTRSRALTLLAPQEASPGRK
jgi:hypothetical protein